MSLIISKVIHTIEKNKMFKKNNKVIVAVSSGPDSIALLYILIKLKKIYNLSLCIAHINYMLRKESIQEKVFVKNLASKYKLPLVTKTVNITKILQEKKENLEALAREIRYEFLDKIAVQKTTKIALGHTKNDNVETILMHFLRGCGLKGLTGIPPVRGKIIRPLIDITKEEILNYLKKEKLGFCVDRSNKDTRFFRNRIRNELLPLLRNKYNPNIDKLLLENIEVLKEEEEFLDQNAKKILEIILKERKKNEIILDLSKFIDYGNLRRRVLLKAIKLLVCKKQIEKKHINKIISFLETKKNGYLNLPDKLQVKKIYNDLIISKEKKIRQSIEFKYQINIPGETDIKEIGAKIITKIITKKKIINNILKLKNNEKAWIDFEKIELPIYLRNPKAGDKFVPLGMKGTKKLKKFFIDLKINAEERKEKPLVTSCQDEILWVVGYRISEKVKVTDKTQKILEIQVKL